jgi:hypothetical protein
VEIHIVYANIEGLDNELSCSNLFLVINMDCFKSGLYTIHLFSKIFQKKNVLEGAIIILHFVFEPTWGI